MSEDEHYLKQELYSLVREDTAVFDFLQEGALDGVWYSDLEQPGNEWMSARFWSTLGYEPGEMQHRCSEWLELVHPDDRKTIESNFQRHCEDPGFPYDQVVRCRHRDGHKVWIRRRGLAIRDPQGKPLRMLGGHFDLTEQKGAEEQLMRLGERFQLAVDSAGIGVWDLDLVNNELIWDERMFELYGVNREEFQGAYDAWRRGLHPADSERTDCEVMDAIQGKKEFDTEFRVIRTDGEERMIKAFAKVVRDADGKPLRMIGVNWDITDQRRLETDLHRLATTDPLTGITNRRQFIERAEEELTRAARYGNRVSLGILDIDHFKRINDAGGHDAGDAVLRALAAECRDQLRASDFVARLGGDEFAIVLLHTTLDDAVMTLDRLREALARLLVQTSTGAFPFTISIGVTETREGEADLDKVLKRADQALYRAKSAGRNRVVRAQT